MLPSLLVAALFATLTVVLVASRFLLSAGDARRGLDRAIVNHHPPQGGGFALALPTNRHPSSTARLRVPCRANPTAMGDARASDPERFTCRRIPRQNQQGSVGHVLQTGSTGAVPRIVPSHMDSIAYPRGCPTPLNAVRW